VIERSQLSQQLPTHNPLCLKQVLQVLQQETAATEPKADMIVAVEAAIRRGLRHGPRIEDVARELNMSGRTLRRRLAAHQMIFEELVENSRKTQALSLLMHSKLSMKAISTELGYSNPSSFRRAFKRWASIAPTSFRAEDSTRSCLVANTGPALSEQLSHSIHSNST
jgi:AraC-like DNA-binding protein